MRASTLPGGRSGRASRWPRRWRTPGAAALPPAQAAGRARVEAYFNGIHTLEADFRQLAPDGSLSHRQAVHRPQPRRHALRLRPAVEDPAGRAGRLAADLLRRQHPAGERHPDRRDAAGLPAQARRSSSPATSRSQVGRGARRARSTSRCVRTDEPDQGQVVLTLAKEPDAASRWSVTDAQGLTTEHRPRQICRPASSSTASCSSGATPSCSACPRIERHG